MCQQMEEISQFELHITAFGQFHGVTHNPTMDLLQSLSDYSAKSEKISISSMDVLKVSAVDSLQYLSDIWQKEIKQKFQSISKATTSISINSPSTKKRKLTTSSGMNRNEGQSKTTANPKKLFLHFGVGSVDQKEFRLEKCGWNEANFRVFLAGFLFLFFDSVVISFQRITVNN
jgi:hypothetical protein